MKDKAMNGRGTFTTPSLGDVPTITMVANYVSVRPGMVRQVGYILGGGFKYFLFIPLFGEMIHFD